MTAVVVGKDDARKVRPLVFRIPPEQVPDPFRDIQLVKGDDSTDMQTIFVDWMNDLPPAVSGRAGMRLEGTLKKYLSAVEHALDNAPLVPTEAVVQEWILRLDDLRSQNRMSEVRSLHDWLNIAFGREQGDKPLDVRLHRRLGELYLNASNYDEAIDQFELARQSSPRDILVLRELGRAYLGAAEKGSDKANQKTREIIEIIGKLDSDAFERNLECAALKGRWLRQRDPSAARDIYQKAFQRNPKSYYAGDLLGQMQLQLKEIDAARNTYRQVLDVINSLGERNLWVQATAANAAIITNADPAIIREKLAAIREFKPSPENLRTIEDGLRRIQESLGSDESALKDWVAALRQ
jgi:tetratricopeptide (TPR) repeat protein